MVNNFLRKNNKDSITIIVYKNLKKDRKPICIRLVSDLKNKLGLVIVFNLKIKNYLLK